MGTNGVMNEEFLDAEYSSVVQTKKSICINPRFNEEERSPEEQAFWPLRWSPRAELLAEPAKTTPAKTVAWTAGVVPMKASSERQLRL